MGCILLLLNYDELWESMNTSLMEGNRHKGKAQMFLCMNHIHPLIFT